MTFVTVNVNREQLTLLSQLLITLFPGCTIHQNRDPMRAIGCLSSRKVDAVFADADTCTSVIGALKRQKDPAPICFLCRQDAALPEEVEPYDDVLSYPITEQKMRMTFQKFSQVSSGCGDRYD